MNPLKQYVNQQHIAIHCKTVEESITINNWIKDLGGQNLHHYYRNNMNNTCYGMEDVSRGINCYGSLHYYLTHGYTIIEASSLMEPQINHSYEIF